MFDVGDKVEVVSNLRECHICEVGMVGTVVCRTSENDILQKGKVFGVKFDHWTEGHSLDSFLKENTTEGQYIADYDLRLCEKFKPYENTELEKLFI